MDRIRPRENRSSIGCRTVDLRAVRPHCTAPGPCDSAGTKTRKCSREKPRRVWSCSAARSGKRDRCCRSRPGPMLSSLW